MAFCDLLHTYHSQVTNVSPACDPTVGNFDVSPCGSPQQATLQCPSSPALVGLEGWKLHIGQRSSPVFIQGKHVLKYIHHVHLILLHVL